MSFLCTCQRTAAETLISVHESRAGSVTGAPGSCRRDLCACGIGPFVCAFAIVAAVSGKSAAGPEGENGTDRGEPGDGGLG